MKNQCLFMLILSVSSSLLYAQEDAACKRYCEKLPKKLLEAILKRKECQQRVGGIHPNGAAFRSWAERALCYEDVAEEIKLNRELVQCQQLGFARDGIDKK